MSVASPRTSQRRGTDQRKWVRHPAGTTTECRLVLDGTIAWWSLEVGDVSVGGICLILDLVLPPESRLTLELYNPARQFVCRRQARMIHLENGPGRNYTSRWVFSSELSYDDIDRLL